MRVSLIVAMTPARVIGRGNTMPWRLPADLKRFKAITWGKPIVMGRRTHESIGRALPGRRNIVVSRNPHYQAAGCEVALSLTAALAGGDADEVMVIGGVALFREALPRAHRIDMTLIHADINGDVYFPKLDWSAWRETERTEHPSDDRNAHPMTFLVFERT